MPAATPDTARTTPSVRARSRRTLLLYLCGAFGGLLSGYDMGIVAGAQLFLTDDLGLSPWMQGAFVSSLMIGAIVGCFGAGPTTDRFGRRPVMLVTAVVFAAGALGMASASGAWTLIAFRTVTGLAVGTASAVIPSYLSELAPTRIRGRISTLNQMMIAVGIFSSYLISYALSDAGAWRWMLGLAVVPAAILFAGMWTQPETPRWLVAHGREDEARTVLLLLRDAEETEAELRDIRTAAQAAHDRRSGLRELFTDLRVRRGLGIAVAMAVIQQIIGSNTIVFYAPTILKAAGFGNSAALLNSVGLGILSICTTFVTGRLVDRVGRKPLLLTGLVLMVISMSTLCAVFSLGLLDQGVGKVAAVASLAVFKVAYSLSWAPLLWVMLPELFPLRVRSIGVSVGSGTNWAANFAVSLIFPVLLTAGAGAAFALFAGICVLAFAFTVAYIRETAGQSLEALEGNAA